MNVAPATAPSAFPSPVSKVVPIPSPAMSAVGQALRDEDGADVIIMGCAGMAKHRAPLEDALGVAGG